LTQLLDGIWFIPEAEAHWKWLHEDLTVKGCSILAFTAIEQ